MKTLHTNNVNTNQSPRPVHLFTTLTGIVIAILCSVALLQDAGFAKYLDIKVPRVLESSRTVAADLLLEVKTWR